MTPKKASLLMFASFGLIVISGAVTYNIIDSRLQQYSADIQAEQATLSANQRQLRATQQAAARLDELDDVQQSIDEIIPAAKNQSNTIADVTALASKSGIAVDSISFAASGDSLGGLSQTIDSELRDLRKLPVTVRGSGKYEQLLEFIRRVENNQRKATVSSINISPQPTSDSYDFSLVINFYVRTR